MSAPKKTMSYRKITDTYDSKGNKVAMDTTSWKNNAERSANMSKQFKAKAATIAELKKYLTDSRTGKDSLVEKKTMKGKPITEKEFNKNK
jgi:hypothetical protein